MTTEIRVMRLEPDTVHGEKLEVTIVYSSFDAKEINEMQENMPSYLRNVRNRDESY